MSNQVIYVRVPVEITDPDYAKGATLQENAVIAVQWWLDKGQRENEAEFGPGPYHLDTSELLLWTEPTLIEDLRDDSDGRSRELDNVRYPVKP